MTLSGMFRIFIAAEKCKLARVFFSFSKFELPAWKRRQISLNILSFAFLNLPVELYPLLPFELIRVFRLQLHRIVC
jgi:hypothetical protein